jgi:hypothetical protein
MRHFDTPNTAPTHRHVLAFPLLIIELRYGDYFPHLIRGFAIAGTHSRNVLIC